MDSVFSKRFVFITGTPRSGTSMITKVIDAHPEVAILMENILGNRRRHGDMAEFWHSTDLLRSIVIKEFESLSEPIIGDKVCTPDVWLPEDIAQICRLFENFKIIFIVRNPINVAMSRLKRADYDEEFNSLGRKTLLLNFESRCKAYMSSWRQSVEAYWKLKDAFGSRVYIIYYEDFCSDFESHLLDLCQFLEIPFSDQMLKWYELPHHSADGTMVKDLKYTDEPVFVSEKFNPNDISKGLEDALLTVRSQYECWEKRQI